ncbi:MAG: ornithine cyclodeaminase [Phycisphaeraceae bacterium]|nr:ornithine cyclodeaminase [Phycisphaeraceae bacterium]
MLLSKEDCRAIARHAGLDVLMDELIDRLTRAIDEYDPQRTSVLARDGFHYHNPYHGLLEWMPVMQVGDTATVKVVGYHPANPTVKGLPTILSTISNYDVTTGHLVGLVDGTFLTALRTAAASAVATRVLAKSGSDTVGMIGCGAQAVSQLHALSRVMSIDRVLFHDRDPKVAATFAERASVGGRVSARFDQTATAALVSTSDVLCTTTSVAIGEGPVFEDRDLRAWVHVNAVGSDFSGKFELPRSLLERSLVVPDCREQAQREGECQQLPPDRIDTDLVALIQQRERFVGSRDKSSVFDSTGWAYEDHVVMQLFLDHAREMGVGTAIEIESHTDDPHDPYDFIVSGAKSEVGSRESEVRS